MYSLCIALEGIFMFIVLSKLTETVGRDVVLRLFFPICICDRRLSVSYLIRESL